MFLSTVSNMIPLKIMPSYFPENFEPFLNINHYSLAQPINSISVRCLVI